MLLLTLLSGLAWADGPKNCKLTVRTWHTDGKEKVEVVEVHAASRSDCKHLAKEREANQDKDIANIRASYGWRGDTD